MFTFTVIAATLSISTGINIIAAVISWRRAKSGFGFYFAIAITSLALWTLASALDYAAVPIPLKVFFAKWEYLFYNTAHAFFLLFLLAYLGYVELANSKLLRLALWTGCGVNVLLAWTNDWHHWLWSGFTPSEFRNNTVIFEHGPAFLWVAGTGYLLYAGIILTAWLAARHGSAYSRRQGLILFYAFLIPLLGNLIYQFQPAQFKGMDWTSVFTSVSIILCVWALYGSKLLDILPIAREKLLDSLSDGMIVLDTQDRIVELNQPAAQMLGDLPVKLTGRNLDEFASLANSLSGYPPGQEIRAEIEIGIGEKRYFDVLVTPLFEKQTQVVGRLIVLRDMTNRKQNELRLIQFSHAIEQSPTSVVITDLAGNITYVNPQFSSLTGYAMEEALGQNPRILQSGQTSPETYRDMWQAIASGKTWKGEFLNKKKNGDLYWEHATMAPVWDPEGRVINYIAVKADITERKQMQAELERLATTDPLTGVYNRRQFALLAELELERGRRYQHPTSMIMLDADFFKEINDSYGHDAGDRVLVALAKLLTREVRSSDLVARYGGEEFTLLLLETPLEKAKGIAERIRATVADTPVLVEDQTIRFTISVGVTSSESTGPDFESLLKEVDRLLYQAKLAGRNRVAASPLDENI